MNRIYKHLVSTSKSVYMDNLNSVVIDYKKAAKNANVGYALSIPYILHYYRHGKIYYILFFITH